MQRVSISLALAALLIGVNGYAYPTCPSTPPATPTFPKLKGSYKVPGGDANTSVVSFTILTGSSLATAEDYTDKVLNCKGTTAGYGQYEYDLSFTSPGVQSQMYVKAKVTTTGQSPVTLCIDFGTDKAIGGSGESADTIVSGDCSDIKPLIFTPPASTFKSTVYKLDLDFTSIKNIVSTPVVVPPVDENRTITAPDTAKTEENATAVVVVNTVTVGDSNVTASATQNKETNTTSATLKIINTKTGETTETNISTGGKLEIQNDGSLKLQSKESNLTVSISNEGKATFSRADTNTTMTLPIVIKEVKDQNGTTEAKGLLPTGEEVSAKNAFGVESLKVVSKDNKQYVLEVKTKNEVVALVALEADELNELNAFLRARDIYLLRSTTLNALQSRFKSDRSFTVSQRLAGEATVSNEPATINDKDISQNKNIEILPSGTAEFQEVQLIGGVRAIKVTSGSAEANVNGERVALEANKYYKLPSVGGLISTKANEWQMLSLPAETTLTDFSIFGTQNRTIWKFVNDAWQGEATGTLKEIKSGEGFWLKIPENRDASISGASYVFDPSVLKSGWNLVGAAKEIENPTANYALQLSYVFRSTGWEKDPSKVNIGEGIWMKK